MKVFARFELSRGRLQADEASLLLEGHWPPGERGAGRWSLDAEIDGRHGGIDQRAAELAEQFAAGGHLGPAESARGFAWLNVVKLRYLLVKLLRVVAFFSQCQHPAASHACRLYYECGRDDEYWHLLQSLAQRRGFQLLTHGIQAGHVPVGPPASARQGRAWRRAAESVARVFQPAVASNRPRIVLCGNPRLLAPVCRELVRRGTQPWWLAASFAPRSWLRWRSVGGGLLACDGGNPTLLAWPETVFTPEPPAAAAPQSDLELLAPAVWAWLLPLARQLLPIQAGEALRVGRHLDHVRPLHVLLDQDGTPLNRAVVAAARQRGVPTTVVQHGAPFIRFGFAPLVADRFCAWGETSADQLQSWNVPRQRICITGAAVQLPTRAVPAARSRPPRFVLLATLAPADSRPDAVTYHLTSATYAAMIRGALASVAEWPRAKLLIKLHPRDPRSKVIRTIAAEFDRLAIKIIARGSLAGVLRSADCVLSCASSAGIEAAAGGWPVIQLMPQGSRELLEPAAWGLVGTARSRAELDELIAHVFAGRWQTSLSQVQSIIAATGCVAACRIADAVLQPAFSVAQPFQGWDPAGRAQSSPDSMPPRPHRIGGVDSSLPTNPALKGRGYGKN
ncbi:MAG TPA: hypothetical protein VIK18_17065 [Pirellulales bacterium]